jgi:hypothetical protein
MKKILAIVLLSSITVLLSACGGTTNNEESFNPDTVQEKLDVDTIVQAVNTKNIALCETVQNEDQKKECKTKVEDQIVLDDAVSTIALDKCDNIKESGTKDKCVILVEGEKAQEEERKKELDYLAEQSNLANKIFEEGNLDKCDEIEEQSYMEQCKNNILLDKAFKSGDSSYCDQLFGEALVNDCKSSLNEEEN